MSTNHVFVINQPVCMSCGLPTANCTCQFSRATANAALDVENYLPIPGATPVESASKDVRNVPDCDCDFLPLPSNLPLRSIEIPTPVSDSDYIPDSLAQNEAVDYLPLPT